jgi:DNA-binding response OmpR family regulator
MIENNKILIVEDQKIIARVNSLLLTKKGFQVTISVNANDAIAKTRELDPRLILMDVQLNEALTGIDVAIIIRAEGFVCPIIFTTGNLLEETKSQVAKITNCQVLIKPVDFSEIEKFL